MNRPPVLPAERRIYVGANFKRGDVSEPLFEWLKLFLSQNPETLALLEFTSPGRDRRQVDCALVGPGGIDLIEVKNKRGVVRGSADGDWSVEDHTGTAVFSNVKYGQSENPYQQASHASDDLSQGLRRFTRNQIRVTPLVLVPAPDPRSLVETRHSRVGLALNISDLKRQLRSVNRASGGGWNGFNIQELPLVLGLRPFDLAFFQGRVISARTHDGVPDVVVNVHFGDHGDVFSVQTDQFGRYTLSSLVHQPVRLHLDVPEQYICPEPFEVCPDGRFIQVPNLELPDRFSVEEIQAAYREQEQHLSRQFEQRISALGEERLHEQAQLGLLLDELTAELRRAQRRIAGLEQGTGGQTISRLALPGQSASGQSASRGEWQKRQITQALERLSSGSAETRGAAMEPTMHLLALLNLVGSTIRPVAQASGATIGRRLELSSRLPMALPADHEAWDEESSADVVDVDSFVLLGESSPGTVVDEATRTRPVERRWLLTGAAGLAILGGGLLIWNRQIPVQDGALPAPRQVAQEPATLPPNMSQDAVPAPPRPLPSTERLPGVAADAPLSAGSADDVPLPGIPANP